VTSSWGIARLDPQIPYDHLRVRLTPLRRIGTPHDVAAAVEFLLSEKASFISGQTLAVDGGLFMQPRWPDADYGV